MQHTQGVHKGWIGRVATLLAVVGAATVMPTLSAQDPPTIDDVIARAAAYVETYVEELSTVVMEEDYQQTYFRGDDDHVSHSQLVSEFLLMRAGGAWVGFRDVFELNGRQLRDRQDRLASLFLGDTRTAVVQARRITEDSSRYNLGSTTRTFNTPTYSLFYLHPANTYRFRFEQAGANCADVDTAWDIRFEEVVYPTLALGFQGISLPSRGHFCIDRESGRVLETQLELHHPSSAGGRLETNATSRVTFALEPRLNLWVPVDMRESYSERGGGRLVGTARYTNYRQFRVTVSENTEPPPDPD